MSLTSVTVLEGLQGTINLQDYSLASITVPPAASTKAVSVQRYNPIRQKSEYRLQHRNPQIAISDNPAANPIRVSFFRFVSLCLRLTTYPLVNSLPPPAIHVAPPLGYCSASTRRLPADSQRLRIRTRYEPHSPVYSLGHCVGVLLGVLCSVYSVSVYSVSVYSLGHCVGACLGVLCLQWMRLIGYIGPRPPSAPSKLSTSILYASADVSAKTFHDTVPAGSIGKFHCASIASLCCYVITRL